MENSILSKYTRKIYLTVIIGYLIYYIPIWLDMIPKHKVYTAHELVQRHGLRIENHTVTTKDGYILTHHRIASHGQEYNEKVVILNHGVMDRSNIWIAFTQDRSLGYYLFNRGYDVWLLNTRGNSISMNHQSLSSEDSEFWNYSFHEIAIYDLSSSIDYILNVTGAKNIDFVGFSMGSTTLFTLFSESPPYANKVKKFVALAPAVYGVNVPEAFPLPELVDAFLKVATILPESMKSGIQVSGGRCEEDNYLSSLSCSLITSLMGKSLLKSVDIDEYKAAVPYLYGSGSMKSLLHFCQVMDSGIFQQYDFGTLQNLEKYGSDTPPSYDLSKCTVPVAIISSKSDSVCTSQGIKKLIKNLPNIKILSEIQDDGFNHNAFFSGLNTTTLVNEKVYKFLKN